MHEPLKCTAARREQAAEQRATLFSINWQLHKQGKHACAVCLNVFEWTHENFHWRNQAKGLLYHICKTCQPGVNRGYAASYTDQKRRRLARAMSKA